MEKKLVSYSLRNYKKELILGPIFKVIEVIFELFTPILMGFIIDFGIKSAINENNYLKIIIPSLMILLFCILGLCSTLVCQYFASIASQGFGTDLRNRIYKKIEELSLKDIELLNSGNLINLLNNDSYKLQLSIAMLIRLVIRAPILVIGSIIMSFLINWKIALITLFVVIILSIILFFILKYSSKQYLKVQSDLDLLSKTTKDSLKGIRVIKAFNNEEEEIKNFKDINNEYYKDVKKINFLNSLTNPLTLLIINLAISLIIYFGAILINKGENLLSGDIFSLTQYLNQIFIALVVITNLLVIFTKAFASLKRVNKLFLIDPSIKNNSKFNKIEINNNEELLRFDNVGFKYLDDGNKVIKNINFNILKGEKVGIIGGTGSGKTTIIKLIERFFDASEGNIFYKGVNIKDYDLKSLHDEISLIPQKAILFKGDIKSNLLMGKKEANNEEIIKALDLALAKDFVFKYQDNINHEVLEHGKNFSGGEKQRLSIARGLIKNSETLIIDDSLSALDNITLKRIRENITSLENKTLIYISQRTSFLESLDKIIVLYHGKVIDVGKHNELLNRCKIYQEIYLSQVENYEK